MDETSLPGTPPDGSVDARLLRLEEEVVFLHRELARLKSSGTAPYPVALTPPSAIAPQDSSPTAQFPPAIPPQPAPSVASSGKTSKSEHPPLFAPSRRESSGSLEDRVGSLWFNRIGIVLLLLGTSWFLKLAIDRGWIGPTARVVLGLLIGASLVLWSERFRSQGFAAFSYSLKALGSGVLYLSLWAGFRLYALFPAPVALSLMIAVTAWNAFMAWAQDAELLAAYALAGGYITPILLSTGGNHETFLFTYLLAIDAAAVLLARTRHWPRLLPAGFGATVAYFIGWYVEYWRPGELWLTVAFIALFGAVFASVSFGLPDDAADLPGHRLSRQSTLIAQILTPLAAAAFLGLALYSVLQDSGHHAWLPWMVLLLAAIYLVLMRVPQTRTSAAVHLSLAVVFLTIAIPLKASGHWITAGWLVEGLALVWVSARLSGAGTIAETYAAAVLRTLGFAALALGFCGIILHLFPPGPVPRLWSSDTGTALLGVTVYAAVALIALRQKASTRWRELAFAALLAIDFVAVLLALAEIAFSWNVPGAPAHPPLASGAFGRALFALAILAGAAALALRRHDEQPDEPLWNLQAAGAVVTFNLLAVLTGVREIAAVWQTSNPAGLVDAEAALKQGLAISAYLTLYGAGLLAAGFWKRSAALRWQGLGLLLFTILKTFLYDMRNLSQGYRVASFLALGVVLMTISYAYQRDWLGLRGAPGPEPTDPFARTPSAKIPRSGANTSE